MNAPSSARLLVIDDDRSVTTALKQALKQEYQVESAPSAEEGLERAGNGSYDLVLLDLYLPDGSGLNVCQQLRETGFNTPILILSGDAQPLSKIALLDAGADDYLTKPFSLGELKARLRVLQRRHANNQKIEPKRLQAYGITLIPARFEDTRESTAVKLRRKEYALLECLMQHAGSVVTRDRLMAYVWGESNDTWTNTIDVHIKYLRDKIDRPFSAPLIHTVHGIGYKLDGRQPVATNNNHKEKE